MTQVSKSQCIQLGSNPGYYLIEDAAHAWDRAVTEFGKLVLITGAWRSYEVQERIFLERYQTAYIQYSPGKVDARAWRGRTWYRKPGTAAAAVPGTSNHGGGVAVDVKTSRSKGDLPYEQAVIFGSWTDADRTRFLRIAAKHGWDDDEGRSVNELWHLTYYPARDQHRGEKPKTNLLEELMTGGLDATQAKQLSTIHAFVTDKIIGDVDGDQTVKSALFRILLFARRTASRSIDEAVAQGVKAAIAGTPGIDEAAVTKGVVAEVRKSLQSLEDTEYVLTPKES